ncbi:HpsJ-like protein, cyanoexosortase C-associated [Leptolyngbya sp. AN03gr2]|uniref:HpsJ-like protein, cyanoexosortase C-associated n=1 Tax=unclassified Leptolyngbya TaxID=2650499 RepID=UPI003D313B26
MASLSTAPQKLSSAPTGKGIAQVVGLVCLVGFAIDMLIVLLPPQLGNIEWRVGFLQQFSDRSLILILGVALTIFGSIGARRRLRQLSTFSLAIGVIYLLSCFLAISDTLSLQQQAVSTIDSQASQLQTQLRNAQANPTALGANVTLEDIKRVSNQLNGQASTIKQNAKRTVIKTGASTVGNLAVVGLGLLGLGRIGLQLSRKN